MYKLGKAVSTIPGAPSNGKGKFEAIWSAVAALTPGEWLPVVFKDEDEVRRITHGVAARKRVRHQIRVRGLTVYIRIRPTN